MYLLMSTQRWKFRSISFLNCYFGVSSGRVGAIERGIHVDEYFIEGVTNRREVFLSAKFSIEKVY